MMFALTRVNVSEPREGRNAKVGPVNLNLCAGHPDSGRPAISCNTDNQSDTAARNAICLRNPPCTRCSPEPGQFGDVCV